MLKIFFKQLIVRLGRLSAMVTLKCDGSRLSAMVYAEIQLGRAMETLKCDGPSRSAIVHSLKSDDQFKIYAKIIIKRMNKI